MGEHPLVVKFIKGIFNERPALPKNTVTWHPQIALDYITGLKETSALTLKELFLKCAVLLWLLSGQRGQTIHMIINKNISLSNEEIKLPIDDPLKTTRPGFHQKEIVLKAFTENEKLGVVKTVKEYLERTANYRDGENHVPQRPETTKEDLKKHNVQRDKRGDGKNGPRHKHIYTSQPEVREYIISQEP